MKHFIALYFLFLAILFAFFYAPSSFVSVGLNNLQTELTLYFLDLFLAPDQIKGVDIWINPHYKIIITQACNGMIPILFLFASILAYQSGILHKIIWMVLGYVVFTMMNVIRILLVAFVTQNGEGQAEFYWSHDLIGNMLLLMTGLGLFILFIKTSKKIKKTES